MFLLVACWLVGPQDAGDAVREFREAWPQAGLDERIALIRELAQIHDPKVLDALAPLLTDGHVTIRITVARELAAFLCVEKTAKKLVEAFRHPGNQTVSTSGVRIVIIRSLGELRCTDALPLIHALFRSPDVWLAKAAIEAAGKMRLKGSVDPLLAELGTMEPPAETDSPEAAAVVGSNPAESGSPWGVMNPAPKIDLKAVLPGKDKFKTKITAGEKKTPVVETEESIRRREILWPALTDALQSITRERWTRLSEWSEWWRRNRAGFLPPK